MAKEGVLRRLGDSAVLSTPQPRNWPKVINTHLPAEEKC